MDDDWIEKECETLEIGDARLVKRAKLILNQQSQMAESTPSAAKDPSALEATYRFVNNPAIQIDTVLRAHNDAAIARCSEQQRVILAQDTTVCDITKPNRQVRGAGPLESEAKRGFFIHPLYALSEDGLVLGLVDQIIWTREEILTGLSKQQKDTLRRQMAFEEKESCRWKEMFQSGEQIARADPQTHYIGVSDSESDIYELLTETDDLASNYDYVLRGCQNRSVHSDDQDFTVDSALNQCDFLFDIEIDVSERTSLIIGETRSRRQSRVGRTAHISVRSTQVKLAGPQRPGGRAPDVVVNVVEAVEKDPPEGEEAIRWLLFTSLPISTVAELSLVLSSYCRRWDIELYFKTLKSGMKIEKLKYEEITAYLCAVSLLMITAFRVEQLKSANRVCPDASCEEFFAETYWQATQMVVFPGIALPNRPPSISEFMRLVAKLGGYIDKKGQGPPGSTTLWRGLRKTESYHEAFVAFNQQE